MELFILVLFSINLFYIQCNFYKLESKLFDIKRQILLNSIDNNFNKENNVINFKNSEF